MNLKSGLDVVQWKKLTRGGFMQFDLEELLHEVNEILYKDMCDENFTTMDMLRNGTNEEIEDYFKKLKREEILRSSFAYNYALEKANLIRARYYVQGIDITSAMREKIYTDYGTDNESWSTFQDYIKEYEDDRFKLYMSCVFGEPESGSEDFQGYFEALKQIHEYLGQDTENTFEDNNKEFRALVEKVIKARTQCMTIVNFTSKFIPPQERFLLENKTITYNEALEIAEYVIDNIDKVASKKNCKPRNIVDDFITDDEIIMRVITDKSGLRRQIMERSLKRFLEHAGVLPESYKNYKKNPKYTPSKKQVLALALYCEPCFDTTGKKPLVQLDYIEKFMNQHSYTLKSTFSTLTPYDVLRDDDVITLIEDGVTVEVLCYILKHFAGTRKDSKKK